MGGDTRPRRRWWLFAVALLAVAALASGVTWLLVGNDDETRPAAVVSTRTPTRTAAPTTPPATPTQSPTPTSSPTPAACGTGAPAFEPVTRAHRVLVAFFGALNDQQYGTAFALLSGELQQNWAPDGTNADALAAFTDFYRQHLRCVTVTLIRLADLADPNVSASMGIQWYEVQFDEDYLSPFPAGSGRLQPYWKVQSDPHALPSDPDGVIVGEGTG